MKVEYFIVNNFIGWSKTESFVKDIILKYNIKSILEIGAGANPTIDPDFISLHRLSYTISDIDDEELKKALPVYNKMVVDLSKTLPKENLTFDLIFSRMVGEHISDGKIFHQNVFKILNKGGLSFHCFSTLYALPFVLNKILPDLISEKLLDVIAPRDKHKHGKFKAHYDWSRGPSKKMINRFETIGFEIIEYCGYFGHGYYHKISFFNKLELIKSKFLLKFPIASLTAYSHFILKKTK